MVAQRGRQRVARHLVAHHTREGVNVDRRKWSHRFPRSTETCRGARQCQVHVRVAPLRPRADAATPGTGTKGCTEPEESPPIPVVHARARFATPQLWPYLTTICVPTIDKGADACGTLWRARESSLKSTHWRGEGGYRIGFDCLLACSGRL